MSDVALRDELHRLETALARRDPTGIPGGLLTLLDEDFLEFGRSGRVWTRESIEPVLHASADVGVASLELEAFDVTPLGGGVALVTYRAAGAHRSSIWVRREGRWRMRFHQGTPVAEDREG